MKKDTGTTKNGRISFFDEPTDFSLVQGGPLFQLLLRTGLLKPPTDFLLRRIIVLVLVAWLPLLVLSIFSGDAVGKSAVSADNRADQIRAIYLKTRKTLFAMSARRSVPTKPDLVADP